MYKKQLIKWTHELVMEGKIKFFEFSDLMDNIRLMTENDAHVFVENEISRRKTAMSVAGVASGVPAWATYRGIRAIFDKCTIDCGILKINTRKRQECIMKCKQEYLKKKLAIDKKSKK